MRLLDRPLRTLARSRLVSAAAWPHGIDRFAELVAPTWASEAVRARVVAVGHQTVDTVTLRLRPNGNWRGHAAGQHVVLTVAVDGVRHSRCFSVASSAHEPRDIELTCKARPTSVVARHLRSVEAGTTVELSQAQGSFVLPATPPAAIALLSAGSGITPVLSMLRTLHDQGHGGEVAFVHYARTGQDVLYGAEVGALVGRHQGWRAVTVTEHDSTGDLEGRFDRGHLAAAGIDAGRFEAFVCGPAPFMAAVAAAWVEAGGAGSRFHTESFGVDAQPSATGGGGRLRFGASGVEVPNDGRPILVQAEAAGLTPVHGCRMGICRTCVVPKASGCVRDAITGKLDTDAGTVVRICVSIPDGDVEIDL